MASPDSIAKILTCKFCGNEDMELQSNMSLWCDQCGALNGVQPKIQQERDRAMNEHRIAATWLADKWLEKDAGN